MSYWKRVREIGRYVERDRRRAESEGRYPRGSVDPEILRRLGASLFSGVDEGGFDDGLSHEAMRLIKEVTRGIYMPPREKRNVGREREQGG